MKFSLIVLVCIAGALLFSSCSKQDSVVTSPTATRYSALIDQIMSGVQETRGLRFIRPIRVGFLSRAQFASMSTSSSGSPVNDSSSIGFSKELEQLGLYSASSNSANIQDSLESNDVAAFYVPGTDSLYVIDANSYDTFQLAEYVAHELTHALQDQHFNPFTSSIFPSQPRSFYNSDFFMAQKFVSEGDAMFSGVYYVFKMKSQEGDAKAYTDAMAYAYAYRGMYWSSIETDPTFKYFDISINSPYDFGMPFIGNTFANGWNAVNALYHSDRVSSCSEVISGKSIVPVRIDFQAEIESMLKDVGYLKYADDDDMGPIVLLALVKDQLSNADTSHVYNAFGYTGDRLYYQWSDSQQYGRLLWRMSFQTRGDADWMFSKLDTVLLNRQLTNQTFVRSQNAATGSLSYTSHSFKTMLFRDSLGITWVEGDSANKVDTLYQMITTQPYLAKSRASGLSKSMNGFLDPAEKQKLLLKFVEHKLRR